MSCNERQPAVNQQGSLIEGVSEEVVGLKEPPVSVFPARPKFPTRIKMEPRVSLIDGTVEMVPVESIVLFERTEEE